MTPTQLRMALGASGLKLDELAAETGTNKSQLSKIKNGKAGASADTMRRLELAFTNRGMEFRQFDSTVCVCSPEIRP